MFDNSQTERQSPAKPDGPISGPDAFEPPARDGGDAGPIVRPRRESGDSEEIRLRPKDVVAVFQRKFDEIAEAKRKTRDGDGDDTTPSESTAKRPKRSGCEDDDSEGEVDDDEEDSIEDDESAGVSRSGRADATRASKRKRVSLGTSAAIRKLVDMEDNGSLCVLGETEKNMFPKTVELLNHTIPVIFDSRVHMWLKAEDFAKALGYKNYKSAVDRFVDPKFVLPYPDVLDLSRARYGDAFRLYAVTNKSLFINEAGVLQLFLRWLITGGNKQQSQQQQQRTESTQSTVEPNDVGIGETTKTNKTPTVKPKISAEWIDYQVLPSLVAFSDAARNGVMAKDIRRGSM